MLTAAIVVVILMTPSLLQSLFRLPPRDLQLANLASTAALCLSTVAIGAAADRFGIRRVAIAVALLLITATYGLYMSAERLPATLLPAYVLAGIGAGGAVLTPIVMVRAFPPSVRFTGVSFSYNLSYAIFGGVTPLFVSWLVHLERLGPAHYVAFVTLLGLFAIFMVAAPQRFQESFAKEDAA
jgi:MFS family permease